MVEDTVPDTPDMLAAEYVLGLLDEADAVAFERRMADNPALAADVDAWRERLGGLFAEIPSAEPGADRWNAIAAQLDATDAAPRTAPATPEPPVDLALARQVRGWRAATAAFAALAACLALLLVWPRAPEPPVVVVRQQPVPVTQPPFAVAQLSSDAGVPLLAVGIEQTGTLRLRVLDLPEDQRVPELWIIPEGGAPQSLGLIRPDGRLDIALAPSVRRQLAGDATLAVSLEQAEGAPHAAPEGPIVATGKVILL